MAEGLAQPRPEGLATALELEQELGVGPALVLLTDQVFDRHLHIGEEDLVDLVAHRRPSAVDQVDRVERDARRLHVDQQEGDALLTLALVGGADETEYPVGEVCVGRPDLLAVHDVVIALALGPGAQGREVGARARLGISLAPQFLGGRDLRQEALLLRVAAELHQDGRHHLDAERRKIGRIGARHLHLEDELLSRGPARSTVFLRPVGAEPALAGQLLLPLQKPLLGDVAAAAATALLGHFRRHVGADPVAHFLLEGQFLIVEG